MNDNKDEPAQVRPTTIVGIQRLARQLAKAHGWRHILALDKASEQAGFQNYRAAHSTLVDPNQFEPQ